MENNFEKQVQQKMDELSLTPSAPVWEGVQKAIRKKSRRRTLLVWLLPLCLLGGGIGYVLLQQKVPDRSVTLQHLPAPVQEQKTGMPENIPAAKPETDPGPQQQNTVAGAPDGASTASQQPSLPANIAGTNSQKISSDPDILSSSTVNRKKNLNIGSVKNIRETQPVIAETFTTEQQPVERYINVGQPFIPLQRQLETLVPHYYLIKKQPDSIVRTANLYFDTALRKMDAAIVAAQSKAPGENLLAAQQFVQAAKQAFKKWHWMIDTRLGTSNASAVNIGMNKSAAFDRQPTATGNASGPLPPQPPSQPSAALAFSAGLQAKRSLNNAVALTAGLQYSYYSNEMNVGTPRRDTAIGNTATFSMVVADYYRNDNKQTKHVNRFHFIELPVGVAYRPLKNIPVQIQHGVSVGRLLGTNNLQYDGTANIYYESEETVRKTQWNLFTAAEFRLLQNKRFSVHAGPQVQYGLRNFYAYASSKKLFFAGLKAGIQF